MRSRALALSLLLLAACTSGNEAPQSEPTPRRSSASERPCDDIDRLVRRVRAGYVPGLSTDISVIPRQPNYVGSAASPVHSGPWDYLAEVPLVVHAPDLVRNAEVRERASMEQVAPSIARWIGVEMPGEPLPGLDTTGTPRLIVVLVWDGGGWNVLREHPGEWPYLRSLLDDSVVYRNFEIGSSPSVTPPVHTTLGTGVLPREHGIPGLRTRRGPGEYVDPFLGMDPSGIRVPTLAERLVEDSAGRSTAAVLASVNWHLGMMGGAVGPVVLIRETGETFTNESLYTLPVAMDAALLERETDALDAADGAHDGLWWEHELSDPLVRYATPAHVAYQQTLLERLIETEELGRDRATDLLFVNFKSVDDAGHNWGMTSAETGETLRSADAALRRLVRFLDDYVGRGSWATLVTADHGQTPYPKESGAWPIGGAELQRDINARFDRNGSDVALADRVSSPGVYVNRPELTANDVTLDRVARWVAGYTVGENLKQGEKLPPSFEGREDEPLFDATLAGSRLAGLSCSR